MFSLPKIVAVIATATLLCASIEVQAQTQTFTLKIGSGTVNDTSQEWMRLFKEGVERRSHGRIKVETYVASALGSNPRLVEGVALGTIEAAVPNTAFLVSLEPRFSIFDAVGVFETPEQSLRVLDDPGIRKMISAYGERKGVETISIFWHSPLAIVSKKAIRAAGDFAGLKLRTPGGAPLVVRPVDRLKASPISMPIMEALPALQNGAIDGIITGSTVASTLKYYDVAKYMTVLPRSMIFVAAVINSNFMKSIGPELADVVREEARKAEAPAVKWGVADANNALEVWAKNSGENIVMSQSAAQTYLNEVTEVARSILSQNQKTFEDYKTLLSASARYQ